MSKSPRTLLTLFLLISTLAAPLRASEKESLEFKKLLSRTAAEGKCKFEGAGTVKPFLVTGNLQGAKANFCFGAAKCEGIDSVRVLTMRAYEDGTCPTLEAYGRRFSDLLEKGEAKENLVVKESKPPTWESISTSTMCAYETPFRLAATPGPVTERQTPVAPPHFCTAIVGCNTQQTDGSWVEQPRTVFACPVVKEKKFADGREFEAETDFCPSVSECYAQQGPAGFKVTKGKIREATPADVEFLAAEDKKRESNLMPSRGRTLAQGRPAIDGSPTSAASETTPGEVHGPAPVRRDPNYLVTASDPRPTSAQ